MASERRALVEREQPELPLTVQAELLGVSRSSLYYQPRMPSAEEVAIKHRIDEIYTACPFFGSRRIAVELRQAGMSVNRKAVQRHMREMGIAGVCPGPNLSKRNQAHAIYPYLLRNVTATYPNHIWGIEVRDLYFASISVLTMGSTSMVQSPSYIICWIPMALPTGNRAVILPVAFSSLSSFRSAIPTLLD
ncbi:MAG: transposase [Caldilineaceae bacterium]|nr:transposase [Caldilineaceae bacterium]